MDSGRMLARLLLVLSLVSLGACSTVETARAPALQKNVRWALLPALNNTETPQAGARLEEITASLMQAHGVNELLHYPPASATPDLLAPADRQAQQAALDWARSQNVRYAVLGSVQEWRYKTGVDGEPAAGITLSILDAGSGKVLWSGTAARTGWSRESVAGVAQKLVDKLLDQALSNSRG